MPTVDITTTEDNPTYTHGEGGGRREFTKTEETPTFWGGGGGGWRIFTKVEGAPTFMWRKLGGIPPSTVGPLLS